MRRLRQQQLEVKALLQLPGIRVLNQRQQMDQLLQLRLNLQLNLKRLLLQQLQLMELQLQLLQLQPMLQQLQQLQQTQPHNQLLKLLPQ